MSASSPKHSVATQALIRAASNSNTRMETHQANVAIRVRDLEEEIRALKSSHNAVTPTCRLPSDILSSIFLLALHCFKTSPSDWVQITHICRHWTMVALDCPSLWAKLQCFHPAFMEVMLTRSRDVPLDVNVNFSRVSLEIRARCRPVLADALSQIGRLRRVDIPDGDTARMLSTISQWKGRAPILEELYLSTLEYVGPRSTPVSEYPEDFLKDGAPQLKILSLRCHGIIWGQLPLGSRLVDLTVCHYGEALQRPSIDEFLKSLREMSVLRRLEIAHITPLMPIPYHLPDVSVTMPNLILVEIEDTPQHIALFLDIVNLPILESLVSNLDCTNEDEDIGQVLRGIKGSFENSKYGPIRKVIDLRVSGEDLKEPTFTVWFRPDAHENNWTGPAQFEVRVCTDRLSILDCLTVLDDCFDFNSTLVALDVEAIMVEPARWAGLWSMLSSKARRLKDIAIDELSYSVSAFFEWWIAALRSPSLGPNACFPSLERLWLRHVSFSGTRYGLGTSEELSALLTEVCEKLANSSRPLSELRIEDCYSFSHEDYLRIQEVAPEVNLVWIEELAESHHSFHLSELAESHHSFHLSELAGSSPS